MRGGVIAFLVALAGVCVYAQFPPAPRTNSIPTIDVDRLAPTNRPSAYYVKYRDVPVAPSFIMVSVLATNTVTGELRAILKARVSAEHRFWRVEIGEKGITTVHVTERLDEPMHLLVRAVIDDGFIFHSLDYTEFP